jgi:DNA-binding Xre family transcriptional regulator
MPRLKNRLDDLIAEKQGDGETITQDKLADATGVSQGTISRWLRQHVDRFDAEIVVKFCDYFECGVGDLLYIEHPDSK